QFRLRVGDRLARGFSSKSAKMNEAKLKTMVLLPALALTGWLLSGSIGFGQDTGIQAMAHRPAVAQKSGSASSGNAGYRVADLFGESDEEKAARLQHEQSQDSSINYARQRVQDLESSVRRLTGEVEQLDHRISELNSRIERMQKDYDYQLCKIAAQQLGASGDDATALPCAGGDSSGSTMRPSAAIPPASSPPPGPSAGPGKTAGEPLHLGAPPGTLGTLPAAPSGATGAVAPPSPNRGKFDAAVKLATRTQYAEARSAFRNFADSYPGDELAPQAVYWV